VLSIVRAGIDEGAKLELEATVPANLPDLGAFLGPRIFTGVRPEMRLFREEIFGPVLSVTAFDDEDDAVRLANASEYALGAGIWTRSLGRAHRMAARIQAGNVWVNHYGVLPVAAPFGGMKRSGWGREGGRDALAEYTQVKNVFVDLTGT
jgi:acyl-CoA reductase-like NAD-dependent aldehyde dehydrogenase